MHFANNKYFQYSKGNINMKNISEIIAKNLISLRKKNNLTQNELADKINYSDNAISRWEHGEVTPSIETLAHISEIFNVPLSSLIEDNALKTAEQNDKTQMINKLAIILISVSLVWFFAVGILVVCQFVYDYNFWKVFLWALPIVSLVMLPFHKYWGRHIYKFVLLTIFLWTLILAIYVQFYALNPALWLIFILGVPINVALAIWAFVKPKPKKTKSPEKLAELQQKKKEKEEKKAQKNASKHHLDNKNSN